MMSRGQESKRSLTGGKVCRLEADDEAEPGTVDDEAYGGGLWAHWSDVHGEYDATHLA